MIGKDKLVAIRTNFSVDHIYSNVAEPHNTKLEITPYDGAVYTLTTIVTEVVEEPHFQARVWLLNMVFSYGQRCHFPSGKDAHVHVMVSLDTLINVTAK